MFRTSSCPSSGATTTAVAASGLPSELGDSSAVGRGRTGGPDHDQQPEFRTPQYGHSPPQIFQVLHNVCIQMVLFIKSDCYAAFVL
jgi:hypothetical protein